MAEYEFAILFEVFSTNVANISLRTLDILLNTSNAFLIEYSPFLRPSNNSIRGFINISKELLINPEEHALKLLIVLSIKPLPLTPSDIPAIGIICG